MKKDKKAPAPACPKCGSTDGWIGPTFIPERVTKTVDRSHPSLLKRGSKTVAEHLQWVCKVCGFHKTEPTKDSKETK